MRNKNTILSILGVITLAGLGLFLFNPSKEANPIPTPTPQPTSSPSNTLGADADDVQIIAVEGGNFYFKPNEIRIKKGQKVRIELKALGMMHDWVIDELNVRTPIIQSGETAVVEFTANESGSFEFYCSVGEHRTQGMVGTLIVEE